MDEHTKPEKKKCEHCGASMMEYIFTIDCLDALLLLGMGTVVKGRMDKKGTPLQEANAVHVQSTLNDYYSVPSRTTQCAKLGLIAKVKREDGSHNQARGWLITRRGFAFLRGEKVPKSVKVFRNRIEERFEEMTTIMEAFDLHRDRVNRAIAARKKPKVDYRGVTDTYNPHEWVEFGGVHNEKLL